MATRKIFWYFEIFEIGSIYNSPPENLSISRRYAWSKINTPPPPMQGGSHQDCRFLNLLIIPWDSKYTPCWPSCRIIPLMTRGALQNFSESTPTATSPIDHTRSQQLPALAIYGLWSQRLAAPTICRVSFFKFWRRNPVSEIRSTGVDFQICPRSVKPKLKCISKYLTYADPIYIKKIEKSISWPCSFKVGY